MVLKRIIYIFAVLMALSSATMSQEEFSILLQNHKENTHEINDLIFKMSMQNLQMRIDNENPEELQEEPINFFHESEEAEGRARIQYIKENFINTKAYIQSMVEKQQQKCETKPIKVPVFDRIVNVGDLYDVRNQELKVGQRLWDLDDKFSHARLLSRDIAFSSIKSGRIQSIIEDMNKLDLKIEVELEILVIFTVGIEFDFYEYTKDNDKEQTAAIWYQGSTVSEKVDDLSIIEYYWDQFNRDDVTHVITGLEWGNEATLYMIQEIEETEDDNKIRGAITGGIDFLLASIDLEVSISFRERVKEMNRKFKIKTKGDMILDGKAPLNFEESIQWMRDIPAELAKVNNGKGKPLTMVLTPLCLVHQAIPWDQKNEYRVLQGYYEEITKTLLDDMYNDIQESEKVKLQLKSLQKDYETANPLVFPAKAQKEFSDYIENFYIFASEKKEKIQHVIEYYQGGDIPGAEAEHKLLNQLKKHSKYNIPNTKGFILKQKQSYQRKQVLLNSLQKQFKEIIFVQENLLRELGDKRKNKVVLYITSDDILTQNEDLEFFKQINLYYTPFQTDYAIVFIDVHKKYDIKGGKSYIQYLKSKGRFVKNLVETSNDYRNSSLHHVSVILNPDDLSDRQIIYDGTINKQEQRDGHGTLYKDPGRVRKNLEKNEGYMNMANKIYYGQWKNDKFNGSGTILEKGKVIIKGQFQDGKTSGFQPYSTLKNQYNGGFDILGHLDGHGKFKDNKGKICEVLHKNGKLDTKKC